MSARLAMLVALLWASGSLAQAQGDWMELKPLEDDKEESLEKAEPPRTLKDLPRKFTYRGKVKHLGPVGFVYLGDFYFIDELDPEMAALAWRQAAETWPWAGPLQQRLHISSIYDGAWLDAAQGFMLDYREDLPPKMQVDWRLDGNAPLTSQDIQDVPEAPTILFRQALQRLRQTPVDDTLLIPRLFLEGMLQALAGMERASLESFQAIPLSDLELPWSDQAALMRGHLYYRSFNPERALLEYQSILDRHSELGGRIEEIRAGFDRPAAKGWGQPMELKVQLVGKTAEGRWALTAPEWDLWPVTEVRGPGAAELKPRIVFRSPDYWVVSLPLGADESGWERGKTVMLVGHPRSKD